MFGTHHPAKIISVLYVDDEPSLLDLGKTFLENTRDFHVHTIESAKEALELLKNVRYDVIVSDYQMPSMDGLTFLKELRNARNKVPFIIFTGKGREDVVIEALNSGADFYLQKGGNPSAQFAELGNMIKQSVCKKKNEILLMRTQRNLATIMDNMIDGMIVADEDGLILAMNKATIKLAGEGNVEKLQYISVFDFLSGDDREELIEDFRKTIYGGMGQLKQYKTKLMDGSKMWVEGISSRIEYEGQNAALIVFRDITQRMKAEEELRLSKERYSSIVESQTEMICRFLPNMDISFTNRSFVRIFEPLISIDVKNLWEVIPESEHEAVKQFLLSFTPDDREKGYSHELPLKDGAMGSVEWNVHAMFDAEGALVEYQAVGRIKVTLKRAVSRN